MTGDLTDVPGIRVGHWTDEVGRTGCTVVLFPPQGAVASVDVRGAAPGSRETDALQPDNQVQVAHAVLLSGGSAFGLAAADGVMQVLEERGLGVPTMAGPVPIVPTSVLYDLAVGSARSRPDAAAGRAATLAAEAGEPCGRGLIGAGTGATVGKLFGPLSARPGGLGTASLALPSGGTVGAVVAVNAVGDVVAADGTLLAGAGTVRRLLAGEGMPPPIASNTTLALIATDRTLTKTQAHRLAVVAHDALAQSIRPVHTSFDGDTVYVAGTGLNTEPLTAWDVLTLETAAVVVLAEAIRSAVL